MARTSGQRGRRTRTHSGALAAARCGAWRLAVSAGLALSPGVVGQEGGLTPEQAAAFARERLEQVQRVGETEGSGAEAEASAPPALADAGASSMEEEDADAGGGPVVQVRDDQTVDISLTEESLATALQMLSIQSERNIVASKGVDARVSANLFGVTFEEALEAILHVNGFGYIERGNFIYVYTLEELRQIREAERRPVSRVIRLNYLNANDAASFVTPLLSEAGEIKTNGDVGTFSITDRPVGDERFALSATLVVFDYPEHVEEIERVLREIDTRPAQVLVEATILETNITENNAFGVDFAGIGGLDFTDFIPGGGPLSVFNGLRNPPAQDATANLDTTGQAIVGTPGNTAGPGTLKIGIVSDDIAVFIRLLDEVADTTVLSNPKLLALNRQPARVLVGERLGYLSTTATETATTQTVEFLDTGTQLAFRPFISNDGMIRMELRPSVSTGRIREAQDASGTPVSIPDEVTQELTTNVLVRDGQTIVLGGLFKETTSLSRRQVPLLGDIPIIGAPFRGHEDEITRSEIIFLITPTIVKDGSLLAEGERAKEAIDEVRAGSRRGLLPWSRESMTAKLNVEADELIRRGEPEKALWKLRRSLELNPLQPEASRMRDRLMERRELWPTRSLLDDILGASEGREEHIHAPGEAAPERAAPTPVSSAGAFGPPADGATKEDE